MGLKADDSFLRFVTMGAIGSLAVIERLREAGFNVIELERYSTSNKIWATKVNACGCQISFAYAPGFASRCVENQTSPSR